MRSIKSSMAFGMAQARSWLVAQAFQPMSRGARSRFELTFLWAHLALVFGFLAYIPYSKHLHIFVSEINVFFTQTKPRGKLETLHIDLENVEGARLGAGTESTAGRVRSASTRSRYRRVSAARRRRDQPSSRPMIAATSAATAPESAASMNSAAGSAT